MRIPMVMPRLTAEMEYGQITWVKSVGERVSRGEVIAEIEAEKVTVELEATADGQLVDIVHEDGTEVPVGDVLAYIEDGSA